MPGVARRTLDAAGGVEQGANQNTVFVNSLPATVLGDKVAPHGPPYPPHITGPVMASASPNVFCENIPVCRQGDVASCGHASTGSHNVFAN